MNGVHHGRLAAEEMGTSRDIEEESIWWIEGDKWRIAQAPIGDLFQKFSIRYFIGAEVKARECAADSEKFSHGNPIP
jgi:hypothetical protein